MWSSFWSLSTLVAVLQFLLSDLPVTRGLQCYNCRGITNYDPNSCFFPVHGKTMVQECTKNEVCEKRVTMVDRLQDVIDRGCSSNCKNRKFIWTDEFQVYCCEDQSLCNVASGRSLSKCLSIFIIPLMIVFALVSWASLSLFTVA